MIFDKTGTLTMGEPVLQRFIATVRRRAAGRGRCLRLAASAEQHTTHPLGLALVSRSQETRNRARCRSKRTKSTPGMGVYAKVGEHAIHIGNRRFMDSQGDRGSEDVRPAKRSAGFVAGESILYFAIDKTLQGAFLVQDTIRPEAHDDARPAAQALGSSACCWPRATRKSRPSTYARGSSASRSPRGALAPSTSLNWSARLGRRLPGRDGGRRRQRCPGTGRGGSEHRDGRAAAATSRSRRRMSPWRATI